MLAWWGFTIPWVEWSQGTVINFTLSLCFLAVSCLLPIRWPRGMARVPIFILMLACTLLSVPVGYLVGRHVPRNQTIVAGAVSAALTVLALLLVLSRWATLNTVADWPHWRLAITVGFMSFLAFWSGAYVAMLTIKTRNAQP